MKLAILTVAAAVVSPFLLAVGVLALVGVVAAAATGTTPLGGLAPLADPTGATTVPLAAPPPDQGAVADIPAAMLAHYQQGTGRCPGLPWTVLAAIGKIETDHGRGPQRSPAGALGPMQFLPSTWATYGVDADGDGIASIWDPADAVAAAAGYLCANGGGDPGRLPAAIWHYNHDQAYVTAVLQQALSYATA